MDYRSKVVASYAANGRVSLPNRGNGMRLVDADVRLMSALVRYGALSFNQAIHWFWGGDRFRASKRVSRLMQAGLVMKSPYEWAGHVLWCTREGIAVVGELSSQVESTIGVARTVAPPPTERLLHRLAVADVGLQWEAQGDYRVVTEREIRAVELSPKVDPYAVAGRLGIRRQPFVDPVSDRARWFAVPELKTGGGLHFPDLVLVTGEGDTFAVEVEITTKAPSRMVDILRAYQYRGVFAGVTYLATGDVRVNLEGYRLVDGSWSDGVLQKAGVVPSGDPSGVPDALVVVGDLEVVDESVAWKLDVRQVPDSKFVSKEEWRRLRRLWRTHSSSQLPDGSTIPFLTWWMQLYPSLVSAGAL